MEFGGINYLAVIAATVAGFVFGSVWYGVLAKQWMQAASVSEEQAKPSAGCLLYTSPSPRDQRGSRMPSSA